MFNLGNAVILLGAAAAIAAVLVKHLRSRHEFERRAEELDAGTEALQKLNADLEKNARALRANEEWYRHLFSTGTDMVLAYSVTEDGIPGQFIDANETACTNLEYDRDKLLTLTPLDVETIRKPDARTDYTGVELLTLSNVEILGRDSSVAAKHVQILVRQILKEGVVVYEGSYVTRSGKMIPVEITASRHEADDQLAVVCRAHNITSRRRVEQSLRESRQRFDDFFSDSPIGAATYGAHREISDVNAACLKMFGVPDHEEFSKFNPFDNPFVPEAARQALSTGGDARYEAVVDFDDVMRDGLLVTSRTGKAHFDIMIKSLGLDHEFNAKGHLVHIQDITQRRMAEAALRERERQLRQAQKMEAIGTLAGGIAHDFNNILTPILGYAELAIDRCEQDVEMRDFMDEILNSSCRAKELVSQILIFSRQTESSTEPIRITSIVKEVMKQQRTSIPDSIEVTVGIKTDRDLVLANPTQIHQILTNLCSNAVHVMREAGGMLDVRMSSFVLGYRHRREFPQLEHGRYLRLSVRDTGTGMDQATAERVFDPFFTTKASGEGTGMGLAVTHGIVTSLGGGISLETELGKGTVFHVVLPTIEETPEKLTETTAPLPSGTERILFVDDEPVITRLAARMLESLGYDPSVAGDGVKALEMFEQNPDRFDLVITDQVMPEMTGSELVDRLLAMRPNLPIILCTGFSDKMSAEQAMAAGVREYVMKPIARRDLAEAIRRALDNTPSPLRPDETVGIADTGLVADEDEDQEPILP